MVPTPTSRRTGADRMPPSPSRAHTSGSSAVFSEVPSFPIAVGKETLGSSWASSSEKIFEVPEDETSSKPILISLDGIEDVQPEGLPKKVSTLGRPPKMSYADRQSNMAPQQVRLCSEMARHASIPFAVMSLMLCLMAVSHSDEDHSLSSVWGSIGGGLSDVYDGECWLSWLLAVCVGLLMVAGVVCTYICHFASSEPSLSKKSSGTGVYKEPTLSQARQRRSAGMSNLIN